MAFKNVEKLGYVSYDIVSMSIYCPIKKKKTRVRWMFYFNFVIVFPVHKTSYPNYGKPAEEIRKGIFGDF